MAAIFKVKLEDNYTDKAKKIASATSQMESAMSKVGSAAKKTKSALKSAFSGKHQVKISEIGSKEAQARIKGLQGELNTISKGKYKVKVNTKTLVSAKKEAFQLSRELTKATGKRHRVKIDLDKPNVGGFMSGLKSKLSSGFSKLNPKKWFGGGGGGLVGSIVKGSLITGAIQKGFGKLNPMNWFGRGKAAMPGAAPPAMGGGGLVGSIVKGSLITGAIQKGFSTLKSGFDATFGAGMARLENIQTSKAKLRGFGHDDKTVNAISKNAMSAVKGTAYGFGEAMTASANAVAAGVKPGKELETHLKTIANSAAATGSDFNEMGSIFNKVKTTGHLQGDEAMQIMDRGIALLPALAKTMNTSVDEVRKKMSKGEVSFEDFSAAMDDATGTVASEMANTFSGAKDNFKAALSRVGAGLLGGSDNEGGLFATLTPMLQGVTKALGPLETAAGKVGDKLGDLATGAIDKVKTGLSYLGDKFKPLGDKLSQMIEPLKGVFGSLKDSFGKIFDSVTDLGTDLGGSILDTILTGAVNGLTTLADITQSYVIPALQTAADFIGTYVVPAIQQMATWIGENVVPKLQELATWIGENVVPKLQELATWIGDNVVPKLQKLAKLVGGAVKLAFDAVKTAVDVAKASFDAIKGAVDTAKGAFDSIKGAVQGAGDALSELPGKIGGIVSNAWGSIKSHLPGNATGTSYFGGGMTRVNERGEEMIQLARGDKIYPAGKTDRIIEKQINNRNQNRETKNITLSPTININGANKNGQEIAKEVNRQLRRLAVNI